MWTAYDAPTSAVNAYFYMPLVKKDPINLTSDLILDRLKVISNESTKLLLAVKIFK